MANRICRRHRSAKCLINIWGIMFISWLNSLTIVFLCCVGKKYKGLIKPKKTNILKFFKNHKKKKC